MANDIKAIKEFFSVPGKPVETQEMMEFWKSLSPQEKEELRTADLS